MSIAINIAAVAAVAILALIVFIANRPADFRVARQTTIHAPASAVFPHINDVREHIRWSPFMQDDPELRCTYEGTPGSVGSSLYWNGGKQTGEGRMILVDSQPETRIGFRLEFLRPFVSTNGAEFTFQPQGNGDTLVTWAMSSHNNFMFKAINLFMNCEKMCGGEFEKGLAQLKAIAENSAAAPLGSSAAPLAAAAR